MTGDAVRQKINEKKSRSRFEKIVCTLTPSSFWTPSEDLAASVVVKAIYSRTTLSLKKTFFQMHGGKEN